MSAYLCLNWLSELRIFRTFNVVLFDSFKSATIGRILCEGLTTSSLIRTCNRKILSRCSIPKRDFKKPSFLSHNTSSHHLTQSYRTWQHDPWRGGIRSYTTDRLLCLHYRRPRWDQRFGIMSGLVACGAVYFQQLDHGSRRASAYVTTRASVGPGYVTTGSFRVAQWSRSRDLSACGRALAPRPLNCGP